MKRLSDHARGGRRRQNTNSIARPVALAVCTTIAGTILLWHSLGLAAILAGPLVGSSAIWTMALITNAR